MAPGSVRAGTLVRLGALTTAVALALAAAPAARSATLATGSAGASPGTTVSGSCGSATVTVRPGPWPGVATISLRVASAWGPIIGASWSLRWQNATSRQGGSYAGSQLVLSDVLVRTDSVWTGRGVVTVSLTALDAVLWWGAHCRGLGPLDQAWIP
jgi:hypothetical protein